MMSLPDFKEKTIVICFASFGQTVSFKNDNLVVKSYEDKIILQHSCYKIFSLWIIGNTNITTGLIQRSKKFGFSIVLFSYGAKPFGYWLSSAEGNFLLREKQYSYSRLDIAFHLVKNKIQNQILLLKSLRKKTDLEKQSIQELENYFAEKFENQDLKQILGLEGVATKIFFKAWFKDFNWKGRKPRTKIDKTNTILDLGYTYLFNVMDAMLNLYGFDVYKGVYHQSFYQRKSLVCDLVEPFRCIIDNRVRTAYNLNQISDEDFSQTTTQCILKVDRTKKYTKWLIQEIMKYKEEIFLYTQKYYRAFMRNKPIEEYPTFYIRG